MPTARRPRLALVPGEPAGIGPELCVRLAHRENAADLVAFADPATLAAAAEALGLPLRMAAADAASAPGLLPVQPVRQARPSRFGQPDPDNAASTIDALHQATNACLEGRLQGMVTGPVHKATVCRGGIDYRGTTELLAAWTGCEVVMMLATRRLRVALATTHLPLARVPGAITRPQLTRTLEILHHDLKRWFGIAAPRILVLGLNPHAGEDGLLGDEEIETIRPVLATLRGRGLDLEGPVPADTAFLPHRLQGIDAVLAMYHDQGLPVLKAQGFEEGVNLTLGLPFPRVAVDHGTALELAGSGRARPESLIAAAEICAELARRGKPD